MSVALLAIGMPDWAKDFINSLFNPVLYTLGGWAVLALLIVGYRWWTKPPVALGILALLVAFFVLAAPDPNFKKIITKPDNVPILSMIFIVGFYLWWSLRQAAVNDERTSKGLPTREKLESDDRVLVWPDLVYIEFIALLAVTVMLVVWSILIKAPLEEPANPARTPNPSKAPWYFLGLQEMLVYFDPWLAGVVLPSLIISGLIVIPYCDRNPKGVGYYTVRDRPFAVSFFLFGFLGLWISLIFMGTFLRGPNWNFFGPFAVWDPHIVEPLSNIDLSEIFWTNWLGQPLPKFWLVREAPGILVLLAFFGGTPLLLAGTIWKKLFKQLGVIRYSLVMVHLLTVGLMIIKMILRWAFNLKYIMHIQEFFFNV